MSIHDWRPALGGAGVLLLATIPASAYAEPISTDRPDFVESSLVVGAGRFQVETSVAHQNDQASGFKSQTLSSPTLLRLGLGDVLETRLETDGYQRDHVDGESAVTGWSEIALGVKWHTSDADWLGASSAVLVHVDIPSGASEFRGKELRPSLRYVAEWAPADRWSVGVMPGVIWNTDDAGDRYTAALIGATAGYAWTDTFRTFAELASEDIGGGDRAPTQVRFDTGFALLLSQDVQLDAAAYAGLNRDTPDLQVALGLSIRW